MSKNVSKFILFFIFTLCIINCKEESKKIKQKNISSIIFLSGYLKISFSDQEIEISSKHKKTNLNYDNVKLFEFIQENDYQSLGNMITKDKLCQKKMCLSKIIINYEDDSKQMFVFDNHFYKKEYKKDHIYKKIISLEEKIIEISNSNIYISQAINSYSFPP